MDVWMYKCVNGYMDGWMYGCDESTHSLAHLNDSFVSTPERLIIFLFLLNDTKIDALNRAAARNACTPCMLSCIGRVYIYVYIYIYI
jgi:hypothetical protein